MTKVDVALNWLSDEVISPDDLSVFFEKRDKGGVLMGDKSGIYFWIHTGRDEAGKEKQRIAYIGETGTFRKRFAAHLKLLLHGLYSAVDCGDGDLLDFYECHTKYYDCHSSEKFECQKRPEKCPYYKPGLPDKVPGLFWTLDKRIAHTNNAIAISHQHVKALTFIFAEVVDANGEQHTAEIRKEVEGLLMLQLLGSIVDRPSLKEGIEKRGRQFCYPKRSFFWGHVSKYPQEIDYTIHPYLPPAFAALIEEELGVKGETWDFSATQIPQLITRQDK